MDKVRGIGAVNQIGTATSIVGGTLSALLGVFALLGASESFRLLVLAVAGLMGVLTLATLWMTHGLERLSMRARWFMRAALASSVLGLLLSGPVQSVRRTLNSPSWMQTMQASTVCGTARRCILEVNGTEASTGKPVRAQFYVTAQRNGGLIVDSQEERWWVHPDRTLNHEMPHLVPGNYKLRIGEPMLTRTITQEVGGLTTDEVGQGLWDSLDSARDPMELGPEFRWQPGDIRISGEVTLQQPVKSEFRNPSGRIRASGNRLVFDHASPFEAVGCLKDNTIVNSTVQVVLPLAVPETNLRLARLSRVIHGWGRD